MEFPSASTSDPSFICRVVETRRYETAILLLLIPFSSFRLLFILRSVSARDRDFDRPRGRAKKRLDVLLEAADGVRRQLADLGFQLVAELSESARRLKSRRLIELVKRQIQRPASRARCAGLTFACDPRPTVDGRYGSVALARKGARDRFYWRS
jgi:hypothetical protein